MTALARLRLRRLARTGVPAHGTATPAATLLTYYLGRALGVGADEVTVRPASFYGAVVRAPAPEGEEPRETYSGNYANFTITNRAAKAAPAELRELGGWSTTEADLHTDAVCVLAVFRHIAWLPDGSRRAFNGYARLIPATGLWEVDNCTGLGWKDLLAGVEGTLLDVLSVDPATLWIFRGEHLGPLT